jgi:hypothetical protein
MLATHLNQLPASCLMPIIATSHLSHALLCKAKPSKFEDMSLPKTLQEVSSSNSG